MLVVGQHPDGLQLLVVEQVGFVDDQDRGAAAFVALGGEGVAGLDGEGGGAVAGWPPRAVTTWCVDAADAGRRVAAGR